MDMVKARRFEVWLVTLDPAQGAEIRKTRPCLVISPDEANQSLQTVIAAPMTTTPRRYPFRVNVRFQGKDGQVALDQMRALDGTRLVRRLGTITEDTRRRVTTTLAEFFA